MTSSTLSSGSVRRLMPRRDGTGGGIYFATADLTGNGLPDIVAPGKDSLYLFENLGPT